MSKNKVEGEPQAVRETTAPGDGHRAHESLWPPHPTVVGMIHLLPLPGAPEYGGSMGPVRDRARRDADALLAGGVDGLLVENYGDRPFFPGAVPPATTAAMAAVVSELVRETPLPVGVNVLRNDAVGALSVAAATGARFVRVNVHTGTMFTDQGLLEGLAHRTLRERSVLCPEVAILADVFVKHGTPPPGLQLVDAARDTWIRGLADGLILTGSETGRPTDPTLFPELREALPEGARLWAGSGVDVGAAGQIGSLADGMIVGSAFQRGGLAGEEVEPARVQAIMGGLGRT